jgi:hypothetical protein
MTNGVLLTMPRFGSVCQSEVTALPSASRCASFDGKNRNIGGRSLQNLVRDDFRAGKRRIKAQIFAARIGFPFRRKRRIYFLFQNFLHNRKAVKRNHAPAARIRRARQTTARQQKRENNNNNREMRKISFYFIHQNFLLFKFSKPNPKACSDDI